MANIKSSIKRAQLAKRQNLINAANKSAIKTYIKRFEEALAGTDADAVLKAYKTVIKKLDKAAGKGLLHKNAVARKKSKLTKKLNSFNANVG